MKVLNIDEEGRFGGPERRIVGVAVALNEKNIQTTVLMPIAQSSYFQQACTDRAVLFACLDITRLTLDKKILVKYVLGFVNELIKIRRYIKDGDFDIVHVNGSYQFKSGLAAFLSGSKVVWHLNDTYAHPLVRFAFAMVSKFSRPVFVVAGQKVGEYYLEEGRRNRAMEIHAPVDTKLFYPREDPLIKDKKIIVVSTVTNSAAAKGLDVFIESAYKIWLKNPNVEFHVACPVRESGKAFYNDCLMRIEELFGTEKIASPIKLFDFVDSVPDFLRRSDLFLYTSRTEASPTAVWEAMASGLPIVTTDVGSVRQYVREGFVGYVCKLDDVDDLSNSVLDIIGSNSFKKMSKHSRKAALDLLSIERAASLHSEIYKLALERKGDGFGV